MTTCSRPECQTTAGCKCVGWWPSAPQAPTYTTNGTPPPSLAGFTDEEIAREYHWRMMRKLGGQRIGVTVPVVPSIG